MKKLVVAGDPIEHSLSPSMHNAALKEMSLDNEYYYTKKHVRKEELRSFIDSFNEIEGANITIPHKIEIIKYLDELTEEAKLIGAVNTIYKEDGKLKGHNTDGIGAIEALKKNINLSEKKVLILGAGGAARAIAFSLCRIDVKKLFIMNRTKEKAEKLVNEVKEKTRCESYFVSFSEDISEIDIVINCTSLGLKGELENESPLDSKKLRQGMIVMDTIYNPLQTKFLQKAEEVGCLPIDGVEMFINQGAKALEIWTGKKVPRDVMRKAVIKELTKLN